MSGMKNISRRSFLKRFGAVVAVAAVSPKVVFDLVKEDRFTVKKVKNELRTRYETRLEAKKQLSEWWAKQIDEEIFKCLTKGD